MSNVVRRSEKLSDKPLVPIGTDEIQKILHETAGSIGEPLDDAEADLAERN